jgi:putative protease
MEVAIGHVTHYYSHLHVAVLELTDGLKLGDKIHILGHTTDFFQAVTSMEIDHRWEIQVNAGDNVALKVIEPVRVHDVIYRVTEQVFAIA